MNSTPPKIPLNFFGMPFGLLGLADVWLVAAGFGLAPVLLGRIITAVAVAVWITVVGAYLRGGGVRHGLADLQDATGGPFAVLIVLTPMLASADALYPLTHTWGTVIVDIGVVATVLVAGFLVGDWISGDIDFNQIHPGYFLPSIAGGFVAAGSAALVHQHGLAEVMFGLGLISWIVVGSIVLGRLFVGPRLPVPLRPTLAIEVAPAGVGTFAAFAINGGHVTPLIEAFAGYGLLMVVVQLRLLPLFRQLRFMPSFWSFTFAWAAVAFSAELWLGIEHPTGWRAESYVIAGLLSLLVAAIAIRTVVALARHEYLPAAPAPAQAPVPARADALAPAPSPAPAEAATEVALARLTAA